MSSECFEVSQQKNLVQKRHDDPNSAPGPGELEECGFVVRFNAPGRRHRDGTYQLVDNYTLFYFKFLHGASRREPGSWLQI